MEGVNISREEWEANEQLQATNKLLLEMVKNQKANAQSIVKVFIITISCYTILLLAIVLGFFFYESSFEKTTWETVLTQEQEAETDDGGTAIVNGGDINYGESER